VPKGEKLIVMELTEQQLEVIDQLAAKVGLDRSALLNSALTFLKWCTKQRRKGRKIASIDLEKQSYTVLKLPKIKK